MHGVHPPLSLGHPVTGGVKTPTTPMRGLLQLFFATGTKVTIPAFFGLTFSFTTPLALEAWVRRPSVEPLIRMRTPATDLPCCATCMMSTTVRPANSDFGETASAVQ